MSYDYYYYYGYYYYFDIQCEGNKKGLLIVFIIIVGIMVFEFVGGFFINSLVLLFDSGYMFFDISLFVFSFVVIWFVN